MNNRWISVGAPAAIVVGLASGGVIAWRTAQARTVVAAQPVTDPVQSEVDGARAQRASGVRGHGLRLRRAALQLYKNGNTQRALDVLAEVAEHPEDRFERFHATRMSAQFLADAGRTNEALTMFAQALANADGDPEVKLHCANGYASAAQQYALLLSYAGRTDEALAATARVGEAGTGDTGDWIVSDTYVNKVAILQRASRHGEVVQAIDSLFARFPNYGRDDGGYFRLQLARADAIDPSRRSDEFVASLRTAWGQRQPHPAAGDLGLALSQSLRARGDAAKALDVDLSVWDLTRQLLPLPAVDRDRVGALQKTALIQLTTAHEQGRPDVAAAALQVLRETASTDDERSEYIRAMARLPAEHRR